MNTTPTPDYGEPWKLSDYNAPIGETGDYEGAEEILTRDNVLAAVSWNPDDEDQKRFQRIIQCVNDCAGMADPAAEIEAMREAIKEAHGALQMVVLETLKQWDSTKPLPCVGTIENAATAALAKLKPFIKP